MKEYVSNKTSDRESFVLLTDIRTYVIMLENKKKVYRERDWTSKPQ